MKQHASSLFTTIMHIFITLCSLNSIILVHELGHWLFCQLFHVPTPIFSLGFGPKIIGIALAKTFFQLSLLPLGGYVEIDMHVFDLQPYTHQLIIMIAGILGNLLFSILSFILVTWHNTRKSPIPIIKAIVPHSVAQQSDLLPEDTIIAIDHNPVDELTFYKKLCIIPYLALSGIALPNIPKHSTNVS
jgi:regulator of sigma E protease